LLSWFAIAAWYVLLVISIFWLGRRLPTTNPF
jgi:hypothetical protein